MYRVLIADDQRLLREGIQMILQLENDMEVVSLSENGQEACEAVRLYGPDIVLMDIKMPVMDGIEALRTIKRDFPKTIVLMLTTFAEEKHIVDALAAGADGFVLKDMTADRVVEMLRESMKGHVLLPAAIATKLAAKLATLSPQGSNEFDEGALQRNGLIFTDRERKIILLMLQGHSNKQIAISLFMSEGTVRNYVSIIYSKIGTNDRKAAMAFLRELLNDEIV
ncbi:response regulator [Cohnella faecalis]|uniref:DNA-binding response regulator n=1 Tax=Cohnella faecalis TaxID=2315694 RepID=A0A398CXA0_9BACL|nr:response regulator transcription factor [Cohnella faecalis]RIE03841.1 DNA-binding response regulator [Cohnella faecalis]